ncbi:MAG TPA: DUF222 domain-containing protein [Mycobacteriales bacterium]|nr:DUF222 domain-containing protein [Mycobacteriales bacterium]
MPDWDALPEVPSWVQEWPVTTLEPATCGGDCACGGAPVPVVPVVDEEPVRWAIPGVWGGTLPVTPSVGPLLTELLDVVDRIAVVDPVLLAEGQALGEAQALLGVQRQLRVLQLARTEDVAARSLYAHSGFRSTAAWLRSVAPDAVVSDRTLARRLTDLPFLHAAVLDGRVSLVGAAKTAGALVKVRRYLDQPDGLVDGVDGEGMVVGIGENVLDLICRQHFGLSSDHPAQAVLLARLQTEVETILGAGGSQQARIEQLLVLLTAELPAEVLKAALDEIVDAIVPSLLEEQDKCAQDKRALALSANPDGSWDLSGTLTPECGERLFIALAAEARRDPANPDDTVLREQHRQQTRETGGQDLVTPGTDLPRWEHDALNGLSWTPDRDQVLVPRSRSKRLHDALNRLLERYLSTGLGGTHGKVPVQATVTISARTLDDSPGAPPGRGGSGRPLARSLIRRWWCDAHVTTLLLSTGWTPLGLVHSARTITGTEHKAATVQFDGRCAGNGCCPGQPDPLIPLVPHHVIGHALAGRTSLGETVMACPTLHHDLHAGKRTIRLRNGRLIDENGYLDEDG